MSILNQTESSIFAIFGHSLGILFYLYLKKSILEKGYSIIRTVQTEKLLSLHVQY